MFTTTTKTASKPVYETFKYPNPYSSVSANNRGVFALPPWKEAKYESFPLLDYRTEANVAKIPAGLDILGFTVANHQSSLTGTQWFSESVVEKLNFPEVQGICQECHWR
jgi:hypothetical protein